MENQNKLLEAAKKLKEQSIFFNNQKAMIANIKSSEHEVEIKSDMTESQASYHEDNSITKLVDVNGIKCFA